jgi:hypothetical protein
VKIKNLVKHYFDHKINWVCKCRSITWSESFLYHYVKLHQEVAYHREELFCHKRHLVDVCQDWKMENTLIYYLHLRYES